MAVQFKSSTAILLFVLGAASLPLAGQPGQTPNQELVKYINDAKHLGVAEARIRKEAITVGWPAAAVDEALAAVKSGKNTPRPDNATAPQMLAASSEKSQPVASGVPEASAPSPAPSGGTSRRTTDDYLIGAGDTLQVSVWKEAEVSVPSVAVRSDGRITVPLIKDVTVGGLTPTQAENAITEALVKFLPDANVTVVVASMNSKKVYLIGAVKKEGPLAYTYGMTVMQALSEAGGLTDYARRKKIYILRSDNGREYRLDFNYEEVVRGERMTQNVMLLAGDTVVVPN